MGGGGGEPRPSGSSRAFLPLNREVVGSRGRKQRRGGHAHLLVNISCPTPIRAPEDFNVCLHICSPRCIQVVLIRTIQTQRGSPALRDNTSSHGALTAIQANTQSYNLFLAS